MKTELLAQRAFLLTGARQWHGQINNLIEGLAADSEDFSKLDDSTFQKKLDGYCITIDGLDKSHTALIKHYVALRETIFPDAAAAEELFDFRNALQKIKTPHFKHAQKCIGEASSDAKKSGATKEPVIEKLNEAKESLGGLLTVLNAGILKEEAKLPTEEIPASKSSSKKKGFWLPLLTGIVIAATPLAPTAYFQYKAAAFERNENERIKNQDFIANYQSDLVTRLGRAKSIYKFLCVKGENAQEYESYRTAMKNLIFGGYEEHNTEQTLKSWDSIIDTLNTKYRHLVKADEASEEIRALGETILHTPPPYSADSFEKLFSDVSLFQDKNFSNQ